MRRYLAPVVAASLIATSSLAFAAASTMSGTVKSYDSATRTLILSDGMIFHMPGGWKDPGVKQGENVKVTYDKKSGRNEATALVIEN